MTDKQIKKGMKVFGEILKQERAKKKMSITEAAEAIGTSHQNLNNMEAGKAFNIINVLRICSYYQLPIGTIDKALK